LNGNIANSVSRSLRYATKFDTQANGKTLQPSSSSSQKKKIYIVRAKLLYLVSMPQTFANTFSEFKITGEILWISSVAKFFLE